MVVTYKWPMTLCSKARKVRVLITLIILKYHIGILFKAVTLHVPFHYYNHYND